MYTQRFLCPGLCLPEVSRLKNSLLEKFILEIGVLYKFLDFYTVFPCLILNFIKHGHLFVTVTVHMTAEILKSSKENQCNGIGVSWELRAVGLTSGLTQLVRGSVLPQLWFTSQPRLQSRTWELHTPRGSPNDTHTESKKSIS